MAWQSIKSHVFVNWSAFKLLVEQNFGLDRDQILNAFFAMSPAKEEDTSNFILRVKTLRARYAVDDMMCYRAFVRVLPLEYRAELDQIANHAALLGTTTVPVISWA